MSTVHDALEALGIAPLVPPMPLRRVRAAEPRARMTSLAMTAAPIDRIPPSNLEAEMAVIGSILVDREMMAAVSEIVTAARFLRASCTRRSSSRSCPAVRDAANRSTRLRSPKNLRASIDARQRRRPAVSHVADGHGADRGVGRVLRANRAGKIGATHASSTRARRSRNIGFEGEEDVEGAIDRSEQVVYEVGRRQMHGDFSRDPQAAQGHVRSRSTACTTAAAIAPGVTSGFRDIDRVHDGLPTGQLHHLGRAPGDGQDVDGAHDGRRGRERRDRSRSRSFSLEMTNEELVTRLLCGEARINSHELAQAATSRTRSGRRSRAA